MNSLMDASWVIARRDFVATVYSKTFILFLLAPLMVFAFGMLAGFAGEADSAAQRPTVAVIADSEVALALQSAHARLSESLGQGALPDLAIMDVEDDVRAQARNLLADPKTNLSAVLTGTLEKPALTGPEGSIDRVGKRIALIIEDAREFNTLRSANISPPPIAIDRIATPHSSGEANMVRYALARAAQGLVFFFTLVLATMMLSNLTEEKSNKVIEVLAAAVPLDAIFFGKLLGMLFVSLVGVTIWGSIAGAAIFYVQNAIDIVVTPAVGWPAFSLLILLYFITNYMLLGALFLGIGGQATNVREVQTLSMPITFGQIAFFLLASAVVGDNGGTITWVAALFPFSSPLAMVALAAQTPTIWIHLAALVWQALWVWIIIRISARLFRVTVMKSGGGEAWFPRLGRKRASSDGR